MRLTVPSYSKLATFTLLICALCGGFFFLTGSHIPKYVVLVLCFLTILASYIVHKAPDLNSYTRSYIEFFTPWAPWYFSVIVLVLFFDGVPESSEFFNALLIMFLIFGALYPQHFERKKVITYLAISLLIVSLAIDFQILTYGFSSGGSSVIGTNKNKVLGITSALTLCCFGTLLFEGHKYNQRIKLLLIASVVASLSSIILAQVRTGILPFLALIPFVCYLKRDNKKVVACAILVPFFLLAMSFVTGRMQQGFTDLQQYQTGVVYTSWGLRLELWKLAINAFEDAPIFGWGKEPYEAMVAAGHTIGIPNFTKLYHFHNDFFNALTAGGLFEVICWFSTLFLMARKSRNDPASLCLLLGVLSAGLVERYWFHHITLFAFVTLWTLLYISNSQFWPGKKQLDHKEEVPKS